MKNRKAVAVAKDVLANIHKFKWKSGQYIANLEKFTGSIQDQIKDIRKTCEVCAMGGIFLSFANIYNDINVVDVIYIGLFNEKWVSDVRIIENLKGVFTEKELRSMEACFEGFCCYNNSEKILDAADEFVKDCLNKGGSKNKKKIMIKICKHIIENNGVFKL